MGQAQHAVLLDNCCLLNLYASRRIEAVARALGQPLVIVDRVQAEALYVRRGGGGDDADERESVDIGNLLSAGILSITTLSQDELATFVAFAADVDDGEAATCAVAFHRSYSVATDDGKALRLLRKHLPHLHYYSTLEMIKIWADAEQVAVDDVRKTIIDVRDRGNFLPPKADPLRRWWEAILLPPTP